MFVKNLIAAAVALVVGGVLAVYLWKPAPPVASEPQPPVVAGDPPVVNPPEKSPVQLASAEQPAPLKAPKPLLKDWQKPALALLLSAEQHGYLEPCGCALIQLGGVARRDDLLRQLRDERGWNVTPLDAGGLVNRKFATRKQSKMKFEATLSALKQMKYGAVSIGMEELKLGPEYLLSQHVPQELPFLGANVVLFDTPDLGTPLPRLTINAGGVKIGVTAVFGPSFKGEVTAADIAIGDPRAALAKVVPAMLAEKPDLLVLLSHASIDESKAFAQEFSQFDIILTTGGPDDPDPKPAFLGKTLFAQVGVKGKHVGVVGFYPQAQERLKFELVDLDPDRFKNTTRMEEVMKFYQERLTSENLAVTEPAIAHPSTADFVGATKCGECHTKAFEKWKTTKHANATESLVSGRKGQEKNWIPRIHDAECLSCHVTGWHPQNVLRYHSGYVDLKTTPHLAGQQCENCHGPGSKHVALEEDFKLKKGTQPTEEMLFWRKQRKLDASQAEKKVCIQCHDADNSPTWNFDEFWPQIEHPGKD